MFIGQKFFRSSAIVLFLPLCFSSFPCLSFANSLCHGSHWAIYTTDLGRNNTIVISSSMVDVSIIPKIRTRTEQTMGLPCLPCPHCHGSFKIPTASYCLLCSGAPVKYFIKCYITLKKEHNHKMLKTIAKAICVKI